jgi:hypothetical protein
MMFEGEAAGANMKFKEPPMPFKSQSVSQPVPNKYFTGYGPDSGLQ